MKIQSQGGTSLLIETQNGSLLLFPEGKVKAGEGTRILFDTPKESDSANELSWPGEYDYNGISIRAMGKGDTDQIQYIVSVEDMRCGIMNSPLPEFTEAEEGLIGDLDILVIPAEDAKKVQKIIEDIDPRVVIPVRAKDEKAYRDVVAACGGKDLEEVKEVKLKKSTLPTDTREVYVLKS